MDMRDVFNEKKNALSQLENLSDEQKEMIQLAMDFGYAAAFCDRTCDINQSPFAGSQYRNAFNIARAKFDTEGKEK